MVHFVGAGSGAPDLITLRGARLLGEADVVIYAGSLVNPELLTLTKPGCELHDSAKLTLEEVIALIERAEREGKTTVRLHTGDPSIYGAVREQFDALTERGIDFDVCPGVSSFCGAAAARRVRAVLAEAETVCYAVPRLEEAGFLPLAKDIYRERFSSMDALIFIGACGIAVREIAPYLVSKKTDPAVLCIDEKMQFVIPLLSGHIGGANDLARRLAAALGAAAVITTATDVNGKFAVDAWAAKNECAISSMLLAKKVAAEILERDVPLVSDFPIKGALPGGIVEKTQGALGIVIGYCTKEPFAETLRLTPRVLRVGIGCRRGTAQETIEAAVAAVLSAHQLDPSAVKGVYSIDLKQQEAGLLAACAKHNWPTVFYTAEELRSVPGEFTDSPFVQEMTGVGNVCERAAMRGAEKLLVKKTAVDGVTVAVAAEHWEVTFG